jgi:hypothetical protein
MNARVVEQILLGASTRGYEQSLGPTSAQVRARGATKSRVCDLLIDETKRQMKDHVGQKLDHLELVALLLDGINADGHAVVVGFPPGPRAGYRLRAGPTRKPGKPAPAPKLRLDD